MHVVQVLFRGGNCFMQVVKDLGARRTNLMQMLQTSERGALTSCR